MGSISFTEQKLTTLRKDSLLPEGKWEMCSTVAAQFYIPPAIPFFPHPHKHFSLLFLSLIIAILVGIKCCLIVLLCISLLINDVEYFFMFFLAICNHFWRNTYSCPLLIFNWVICCWVVGVSYILWILSPYHIHDLQGFIFSHSVGHLFTSDGKCSDGTKVLILLRFSLSCCRCSRFWCHG